MSLMKILKSSGPNVDPCRTLTDIFTHSLKELFILQRWSPANKRLDEDVLKTSFVFVFRRRLQDVLIKTNIFVLVIHLQDVFKAFWRHLQDVYEMFWKRLQDVFKTSSRRLAKMSSRRFQDVSSSYTVLVNKFSRCLQDVFTTFLRRTAKIDLPIYLDRSI